MYVLAQGPETKSSIAMAKRGPRAPQSELRRVCIKRSYEIIYHWRDQGYPLEKYDTLVKAAFTYLKKHKGIFDPEPPTPPEVEGGSELRENNPASSSR